MYFIYNIDINFTLNLRGVLSSNSDVSQLRPNSYFYDIMLLLVVNIDF
nr:MAG TPA: hypothetical protein [Caudoviricetes sp.]